MKQVLICFLSLVWVIPMFAQSIEELQFAVQKADTPKEKIHLSQKLSEKLLVKSPDQALLYAAEAYQLAQQEDDIKGLAYLSYIQGKIHIRQSNNPQAIEQFSKSLSHAKSGEDISLIYRCIKKLVTLLKREKKYRQAIALAEEGMLLLNESRMQLTQNTTEGTSLPVVVKPLIKEEAPKEDISIKPTSSLPDEELLSLNQEKEQLKKEIEGLKAERDEYLKFDLEKDLSNKKEGVDSQNELTTIPIYSTQHNPRGIIALTILSALLFLGWFFYSRFRENQKINQLISEKNKIINDERKRSSDLLLNILPASIANELTNKGHASAKKYEYASVLFADFKNFTKISKQLQPEQLVKELDHCFKAFDLIIAKYDNIEKIKTIGDSYLCATGLTTRETLPTNLVKAALEMQDFLNEYKKEKLARSEPFFEARIGIHTGSVVAGVVGLNKFAYDIWGDTVNIAANMESHCEEGKVNISGETYRLVKYEFDCVHRGTIQVKDEEQIDMYYVN